MMLHDVLIVVGPTATRPGGQSSRLIFSGSRETAGLHGRGPVAWKHGWCSLTEFLTRCSGALRARLAALERRPLSRRNHLGALIAMLACPCHLGVLLALTSGTALGGWLAAQRAWLYALLTVAFAAGLVTLFRRNRGTCDHCVP